QMTAHREGQRAPGADDGARDIRAPSQYASATMPTTETTSSPDPGSERRRRYVRLPQPIHFPASEEVPETNRHLELRTALYQILKPELAARATIGSDQFVYYDPTSAKKRLAPNAFVKLDCPHWVFRVWKTWLPGHCAQTPFTQARLAGRHRVCSRVSDT